MMMKIFSPSDMDTLTQRAKDSLRLRQYSNIHNSFEEPCQRLFNAIEPSSYIRPHKHSIDRRDELLIAIRGIFACIIFTDNGLVSQVVYFGSEKYGTDMSLGVEVGADTWHTILALKSGSVLLEVKEGPFDFSSAKEFACWSPQEGSQGVSDFIQDLYCHLDEKLLKAVGVVDLAKRV